ncbi:MAG TPA: hypothetical protein VKH43_00155 [Thermoanaerobaculia bacterium]|nr:hypothetical protein [Thermoanaerobaculia bacterium]
MHSSRSSRSPAAGGAPEALDRARAAVPARFVDPGRNDLSGLAREPGDLIASVSSR